MKIAEAVQGFVQWKRDYGYVYEHGSRTLREFSLTFPGMDLEQIGADHILIFLNRPSLSVETWRLKYWTLLRFFEHWSNRGKIPYFTMPTPKPPVPRTFIPHIYTTFEVHALLAATSQTANTWRRIDAQTVRAMILFLYGTGASAGEAVAIKLEDFNLDNGCVELAKLQPARARQIPIGKDLLTVLRVLLESRPAMARQESYLFENNRGCRISHASLAWHFRRIQRRAGIRRKEGNRYHPRVDDLRFTFAVHRITDWIREGLDLTRMLPALAAYMGQVGLGSTERYLFLTPERFRQDIYKLSPARGRGRWSEDQALIKFLAGI